MSCYEMSSTFRELRIAIYWKHYRLYHICMFNSLHVMLLLSILCSPMTHFCQFLTHFCQFLSKICLSDKTTIIGRSVPIVLDACDHQDLTTLTARLVKKKITYMKIPEQEKWRIGVIHDMRNILNGDIQQTNLTTDQAKCLLDFACTSWNYS